MKKHNNNKIYINYYLLSKYSLNSLKSYPKIQYVYYNIILYYKQKYKYILFIYIITLILFLNFNLKTSFYFKNTYINLLQLYIRHEKAIFEFLNNFIYIYFPLIDSFTTEFKYSIQKHVITFNFFKFPLLFELNILFLSLEYLFIFLNNYKFQLQFILKKQKNNLINHNYLQASKLPLILK